jgi:hypothetical protein
MLMMCIFNWGREGGGSYEPLLCLSYELLEELLAYFEINISSLFSNPKNVCAIQYWNLNNLISYHIVLEPKKW